MNNGTAAIEDYEARPVSLRDQELLWGDACQHALLDEAARQRCLEGGSPVPPPPAASAEEHAWHRPLCA
jgi:hypothetical protein